MSLELEGGGQVGAGGGSREVVSHLQGSCSMKPRQSLGPTKVLLWLHDRALESVRT
jgi:hypothetical protein